MNKYISLNKNKDFRRTYTMGKYAFSKCLVTYVLKNRYKCIRVGMATGKKIGNAVKRNRARRILRAAFYEIQSKISNGLDIIFVARKETPSLKSYDVLKEMSYQLKKLGVLR